MESQEKKTKREIIDFDIDLAQEVLKSGIGRIITKSGYEIKILLWDSVTSEMYPIVGSNEELNLGIVRNQYSEKGRSSLYNGHNLRLVQIAKDYEHVIEVFEEDDINYKIRQYDL